MGDYIYFILQSMNDDGMFDWNLGFRHIEDLMKAVQLQYGGLYYIDLNDMTMKDSRVQGVVGRVVKIKIC